MADVTPNLRLIKPEASDNISPQIFADNFDKIDAEIAALQIDYVIAQGTQGVWDYRRWASGIAECWIEDYNVKIVVTTQWGKAPIYTCNIKSPGDYPFVFQSIPIVIPTWAKSGTYSSPIWARPGGTTIKCPEFQLIDPLKNKNGRNVTLGVYVKGRWK